jgi:hypothetical protein
MEWKDLIYELFDKKGKFLGVFIEKKLWEKIEKEVYTLLEKGNKPSEKILDYKEPIEDWELFKKCWDFKYPYDFSVKCEICGNETQNWEQDEEKKFLLTAASVSGLVSFKCLKCGSKIVKKHFKDKIVSETIPYSPKDK